MTYKQALDNLDYNQFIFTSDLLSVDEYERYVVVTVNDAGTITNMQCAENSDKFTIDMLDRNETGYLLDTLNLFLESKGENSLSRLEQKYGY